MTLPEELAVLVRARLPGLNVSGVLAAALRELVDCRHVRLCCAACGGMVGRAELVDVALSGFYRELMGELGGPVSRCETAEGAARVAKALAVGWGVSAAAVTPLPRPTASQRARAHAELVADAERAQQDLFALPTRRERRVA